MRARFTAYDGDGRRTAYDGDGRRTAYDGDGRRTAYDGDGRGCAAIMTASRTFFVTALLAVLLAAAGAFVTAEAGEAEGRKDRARGQDGHILWQRCKDGPANETGWNACKFFVGVGREMFGVMGRIILDPTEKLCFTGRFDEESDARILTDYLRGHPEERSGKAMEIYFKAFRDRYRCRAAPTAPPKK